MDYVSSEYQGIKVNRSGTGVVVMTLHNMEGANAITLQMMQAMGEILPQVAADPAAKVLVITGAGEAFSSGGNIEALDSETRTSKAEGPLSRPIWNVANLSAEERLQNNQTTGLRIMRQIHELEKPVIAAINGPAAGAGMDLALWCDLRIMASTTFMVHAYATVGLVPFDGGMWLLPRIVGLGRAFEIMFDNPRLSAATCLEWGLVNKITPQDQVLSTAIAWGEQLAMGPTMAFGLIKHITQRSLSIDAASSLELSYQARDAVFSSDDHREGVQAFRERRQPQFTGR